MIPASLLLCVHWLVVPFTWSLWIKIKNKKKAGLIYYNSYKLYVYRGVLAEVACWVHIPKVDGSIPSPASKKVKKVVCFVI